MQITLDTNYLSDVDRQILGLLAGGTFVLDGEPQTFDEEQVYDTEPDVDEEPLEPAVEPEPAAKRTRKKAAPEPEPEPEEEPEPMAEEAVEDEEPADEDVDDDMSDEDLLALAVKKATEMVGGGQAAAVREALDAAGASRVRELNADNVREFFRALG